MVIFDGNVLNLMGSKQWSFPRLLQLSVSQLGNFLLHWSHEDSLPYYLIEALLFSFTFRFRIHLELIFVWSVKCYFIPLSIEISNIIVLLIKILSLFHSLIEPHLWNCVCVCVCAHCKASGISSLVFGSICPNLCPNFWFVQIKIKLFWLLCFYNKSWY